MLNQLLGVDVLEWYHPIVKFHQQKNTKWWGTRAGNNMH
jgi:hypothetical protein